MNIIPSNFTVGTGHNVWCDRGMRGWSHRPVQTPSVNISGCNSMKSDGPTSIPQHIPRQFQRMEPDENFGVTGHGGHEESGSRRPYKCICRRWKNGCLGHPKRGGPCGSSTLNILQASAFWNWNCLPSLSQLVGQPILQIMVGVRLC